MTRPIVSVFAVFVCLAIALPMFASYGTKDETALVVGEEAFSASDSSTTWLTGVISPLRFINGGNGYLTAAVMLPEGASVTGIQVEGCDFSANGQLYVVLNSCPGTGICSVITAVSTGAAATPGCTIPRTTVSNVTIDNVHNTYALQYSNPGETNGNVSFRAVRVYYKLQVSPAPQTATFTDVPTSHPFFQYIEALAAAGITGGCAPGQYCPDAPITRGQMAVFLSRALGLHWVP